MKWILVVVALAVPRVAAAQHPCDLAPVLTQTIQSAAPYQDLFCAKPAEALQGFVRVINGVVTDLLPMSLVQAANAAGFALYAGPATIQLPRGSYQYQVRVYNLNQFTAEVQLSPLSNPLSFTVDESNPPPTGPILKGLQR